MEIKTLDINNYEKVIHATDADTGLNAFIGVHSTKLGPALGGTRIWKYESDDDALTDVLRLSEGMTYKNSLANLNLGGGKAVINLTGTEKTEALLKKFGEAVESLKGTYITAEDVGTTVPDMEIIKTVTDHVSSLQSGNPSPATAFGVFKAIQACFDFWLTPEVKKHWNGHCSLQNKTVAIQGLGNVGYALAEMLAFHKMKIFGSDINEETCKRAAKELGVTIVGTDEIHKLDVDVFSPCALGATLNYDTIGDLKCKFICGSANNQLSIPEIGKDLMRMGVHYAPDYLVNAGGVMNIYREWGHVDTDFHTASMMEGIYDRTILCFKIGLEEGLPTNVVADMLAKQRLSED